MGPPSLTWIRASVWRPLRIILPQNSIRSRKGHSFSVKPLLFGAPSPVVAASGKWFLPFQRLQTPCPFFLFLSAASPENARVGAGLGDRGTTGTTGEAPPAWEVSNASKSEVFSYSTMPSGMLVASWLVVDDNERGQRGFRDPPADRRCQNLYL